MLGSDAHKNTSFDIRIFLKVAQRLFNQFRIGDQLSCLVFRTECPVEGSNVGLF